MIDHKSNYLSELDFAEDYYLIYVPETIFPIEKEGYSTLKTRTDYTQPDDRGILFALGLIASMLLFSGIQLQLAFNASPYKLRFTSPPKTSILNQKQLTTAMPREKLNHQDSNRHIEKLLMINAVAHIKF